MLRGEQLRRAREQADRSRLVAALLRVVGAREQVRSRAFCQRPGCGVEPAQLGPLAVGLLEVVAEDLVELDQP